MTEKRVRNLTSHIVSGIEPDGLVVRLDEERKETSEAVGEGGAVISRIYYPWGGQLGPQNRGLPIVEKAWSSGNLPDEEEGVLLIVSALVANQYPTRDDLVCPETKREEGEIKCTALVKGRSVDMGKVTSDSWMAGFDAGVDDARKEGRRDLMATSAAILEMLQEGDVASVVKKLYHLAGNDM